MTTSGGAGSRRQRILQILTEAVAERPVPDLQTLAVRVGDITSERARQLLAEHGLHAQWKAQRALDRKEQALRISLQRKQQHRNGPELARLVADARARGYAVSTDRGSNVRLEGVPVRVHVLTKAYPFGVGKQRRRYYHVSVQRSSLHVVVFPSGERYFVMPDEVGPPYKYFREDRVPAERWPSAEALRLSGRGRAGERGDVPEAGTSGGGCGGEADVPLTGAGVRGEGAHPSSDRQRGGVEDT